MGFCMRPVEIKFKIEKENEAKAFKAIKSKFSKTRNADNLSEAMQIMRWEISESSEGIDDVEFLGEKLGEDHELFKTIAPYVKAGSYIEMSGDEGTSWRWSFDGNTCHEISPKVEWPEIEPITKVKLEFEKNLVVSTCHITEDEMNILSSGETSLVCYDTEYFALIYVAGDSVGNEFTPEFKALINLAKKNGCQYLKIDRDGPILEGFETYDW